MTFDPDLLIITANTTQAEIILRASSFSDGKMWNAKGTTCLACAWIYAHPYLSGEMNYTVSGLGFSMKARGVLPDGLFIITFPFDTISPLIENLKDMEWDPYWFHLGREGFIKETKKRSGELAQKVRPEFFRARDIKRRLSSKKTLNKTAPEMIFPDAVHFSFMNRR